MALSVKFKYKEESMGFSPTNKQPEESLYILRAANG